MPSKRSSARAAPQKSSASAFTNAGATATQLNRSSVIKHAISTFQSHSSLFASVVQGIDAQVLRIHDTVTGRQQCDHSLGDGKVSCLAWGRYGGGKQRATKKRKKTADGEDADGEEVIAIGALNRPEIELYSPAQAQVIAVLSDAHTQGVKDFQFGTRESSKKAWSLGGDGKLVEWNMHDGTILRSIQLPSGPAQSNIIHPRASHVLCAQSTIYGIDPENISEFSTLTAFASNVHTIVAKTGAKDASEIKSVISAADGERSIQVHNYQNSQIQGQMVANDAVESFSLSDEDHPNLRLLAAVTERGEINIFEKPFDFGITDPKLAKSAKAAKRAMTKKPTATLKISRPNNEKEAVPILEVAFDDNALVLAWMEGAAYPCFHRVEWRSPDGTSLLDGDHTVVKAKNQNVTTNARMNGLKPGRTQVNDAHTVVVKGGEAEDEGMDVDADGPEVVDISSAEEESSDEEAAATEMGSEQQLLTNGASADDEDMDGVLATNSDNESMNDAEVEQPSFGELLRAKAPEIVDVASAFPTQAQAALVPQGAKSVGLPSGMTLSTVLTQALRTSDRQLLESCFHERDLKVVQATIENLSSSLAGALLEQLAERLHSRPGRAGSLMVWIKWTLVAHGGHLAGQPKVVKQLRQLQGVVKERAQALQPLLLLKGKLDMLDAQMQLRKRKIERSRQSQVAQEEDEDRTAIYIEGEPEIDSDEEIDVGTASAVGTAAAVDAEDIEFDSDEEEEVDPAMEMEADDDEDDDDEEDEDESGNELIDDEAEEADSDGEMSGDDIDHDDVDSVDEDGDDSESEAEIPATKAKSRAKINGIVKRR